MDQTTLGYLLIPANSLLFAGLFFVNKEYGKRFDGGLKASLWFALIAGLVNALCFLICALAEGWHFSPLSLAFGAGIGLCFVLLQVSGALASRLGNMSFYSQSFMLGAMILPFFYGVIWNGEGANWMKILAIVLMILSLVLPLLDERKKSATQEKKDKKATIAFYLLCLLAFVANGAFCVLVAMQGKYVPESSPFASIFSFSAFIVLFALLGLGALLFKKRPASDEQAKEKVSKKRLGQFALLSSAYGLFNAWGTYTGMEGIARIDASLFFPVASGICMGLTFLLCRFAYKEKNGLFANIGTGLTMLSVAFFLGSAFLPI